MTVRKSDGNVEGDRGFTSKSYSEVRKNKEIEEK